MAINYILAENPRVRYATGATMYFAQGVPYGLMNIAIPAWLASNGVGAGQIASFLAVIILPWAFKLLSGEFADLATLTASDIFKRLTSRERR